MAEKSKKPVKKPVKHKMWVLYDATGGLFGWYDSREEAIADAWGPVFRPKCTVVQYAKVPGSVKRVTQKMVAEVINLDC